MPQEPNQSRQLFPDQIRGIALLGIVLVNAPFMAISLYGFDQASLEGGINRVTAFLVTMLAQTKFYLLFSFLFGYSSMFIIRDDTRPRRRVYRRRLLALFILGVLHYVLLFIGDILVAYSVLGLALMLMFKRTNKTLLVTSVTVWVVATVVGLLAAIAISLVPNDGELPPEVDEIGEAYAIAMSSGTFFEAAWARVELLPIVLSNSFLVVGFVFVAFCLGLFAARHQLLNRLPEFSLFFRRAAIWGLALGLPIQFGLTWLILGPGEAVGADASPGQQSLQILLALFAPVLTLGYIGAFATLALKRPRSLRFLAAPGRASLTIYLGESLLLCLIFCGWGFGLFGQLGAAGVTAIAFMTWGALAIATTWWLKRFGQGPLEILVSRATKGPLSTK